MKKIIIFFAALAAVLSCSKENPSNYNPVDGTYSVTLSASAPGADTKTTLVDGEGTKFVHWSKGDAIKVLFFPSSSQYSALNGACGELTSTFTNETSEKAYFRTESWSWNNVDMSINSNRSYYKDGIALYPHTAVANSSKKKGYGGSSMTSEVAFELPEAQKAVANNIESGLNFSYAEVPLNNFIETVYHNSTTELKFQNACALIELTMPDSFGDKKVTRISVKSDDKLPLTGKGSVGLVDSKDGIKYPLNVTVSEGANVVLSCEEGFMPRTKYYAVVWPGEHPSGLTFTFVAEDGTVASKSTQKKTVLTASKVKPYTFSSALEFEAVVQEEYDYVYADGTMGNDVNNDIVGVVIFHGNPKEKFNDPDLPNHYCNGLAISVSSRKCAWNSESISVPEGVMTSGSTNDNIKGFDIGGYTVKNAYGANNYTVFDNGSAPNNTSGWYLGTPKEWNFIYEKLDNINALLDGVGETINPTNKATSYWLPVFYNKQAICVYFSNNGLTYDREQYYFYPSLSNYCYYARPIFAF